MRPNSIGASKTIQEYNGWLFRTAIEMLGAGHPDLEDVAQEGRIAMWHALSTFDPSKGALPGWLTLKAKHRMHDLAYGRRPWAGQPPNRDGRHPVERPLVLSLDAERGDGITLADTLASYDTTGEEVPACRADVLAAVSRLPLKLRRYVEARFFGDVLQWDNGEFGRNTGAVWRYARQRLGRELAHLRNEAA